MISTETLTTWNASIAQPIQAQASNTRSKILPPTSASLIAAPFVDVRAHSVQRTISDLILAICSGAILLLRASKRDSFAMSCHFLASSGVRCVNVMPAFSSLARSAAMSSASTAAMFLSLSIWASMRRLPLLSRQAVELAQVEVSECRVRRPERVSQRILRNLSQSHVVNEDGIGRRLHHATLQRSVDLRDIHSNRNGPHSLKQRVISRVRADFNAPEVIELVDWLFGKNIETGVRRGAADDLHVHLLVRLIEHLEIA